MPDETPGPVTAAVRATLDHLRSEALLGPEHTGLVVLVEVCARDVDGEPKLSVAKSSTTKLLAELLGRLHTRQRARQRRAARRPGGPLRYPQVAS